MEAKNRNIRGLITITVWITSFFQAMESINIEELMSIRFLDWTICDTFKSMGKKAACKHSGRSRIALNIVIQVKIFPLKDSVSAFPQCAHFNARYRLHDFTAITFVSYCAVLYISSNSLCVFLQNATEFCNLILSHSKKAHLEIYFRIYLIIAQQINYSWRTIIRIVESSKLKQHAELFECSFYTLSDGFTECVVAWMRSFAWLPS